ncbi:MAG: circularly permuted type 2 ATP-grasp protein [Planctomycetota bacterium]
MQSPSQQQSTGTVEPTTASSIFDGYTPPVGAFDEMIDADGAIKPVWRDFRERMDRLGADELARRWAQSQRLIEENGVAYSPYGDPENRPRPWALDPAPLLLPEAEWNHIAKGLKQRAKLLELILQDLYGEQRLIARGLLPAELLYGHPSYRLPLHRPAPADGEKRPPMLPLYSADIGRAPDGGWWVLADRTEAPSGIGFALENRVVTSRMLAEPFREGKVRRLAPFFLQLQSALRRLAPTALPNPAVAILSQGGSHPNYFEDAYLSRYLGYQLVEGNDLTVRDQRLWMKTLDGLMAIDVLLRRPNTEDCDPLELRGESPSGVAGLLQAERAGSLLVANACGSGLIESPVFMAFMPRLCKELLGEALLMPGVASWWCGEPESLDYVVANIDRLVLKRAYRLRGRESSLMAQLRQTPREELIRQIKADPRSFVAQELVNRSTAPAYSNGVMVPVRVALRAFTMSSETGRNVMLGALARTTPDLGPLESSAFSGEGSKDVWVIGERPVRPISLLPGEDEPTELVRLGSALPSRVADHSFWMGRHLERADAAARLIRIVATRLTSEGDAAECEELPALVRALAEIGQIEPGHAVEGMKDRLPSVERTLPQQVLSQGQPSSLRATVERMFVAASQVRDRLSRDTWRIVLRVNEDFRNLDASSADLTDLLNVTNELILDLAALGGMVIESMTRTQFYRFLDIGRRLERAIQSVDVIHTCLIQAGDASPALLESLLESADSLMTYRARYRASVKLAPVLDLLITDETNPRSIAYQLNTLERHVGKLPRANAAGADTPPEQRLALDLSHSVRMADIRYVCESYELGHPKVLADLLGSLAKDLPALSQAIALKYLAHAGPTRQLAPN